MRFLTFSGRTAKEILRDPLNLGFGLGFPVILILLLSAIQDVYKRQAFYRIWQRIFAGCRDPPVNRFDLFKNE